MSDDDVMMDESGDEGFGAIDETIRDMSDRDLAFELSLPHELSSLARKEKMDMLVFKRNHNELDWEEELTRVQELHSRKVDLERLQQKMKGAADSEKSSGNKRGRGKKVIDDDEYEKDDVSDMDLDALEAESDDDDLFDSDEDREIDNKKKTRAKPASKKVAKKTTSVKKKAKKSSLDSDSDDDLADPAGNYEYVQLTSLFCFLSLSYVYTYMPTNISFHFISFIYIVTLMTMMMTWT